MNLFDTIGGWIDTGVDWVAEAFGYEDIIEDAGLTPDDAFTFTAGKQLISDVKSFTDSDTFGFIKKGVKSYGEASGIFDKQGKPTSNQLFTQTKFKTKARPVADLTSGSRAYMRTSPVTGNPVSVGYKNPDVKSYLTALAQSSYNQQMNNMFSNYIVSPNKPSGQKTIGIGSTTVKGVTKKTKTSRKSRGLV